MGTTPSIITRLGYSGGDLKKGLEDAKRQVNDYKAQRYLAEAEIRRAVAATSGLTGDALKKQRDQVASLKGSYSELVAKLKETQAAHTMMASQAQESTKNYRNTLERIVGGFTMTGFLQGAGVIGIGQMIGNLPSTLKDAALSGGEYAHGLELISQKTGIAIPALQQLAFIGKTTGLTLDDLVVATRKFSTALVGGEGVDGLEGSTGRGAKILRTLGIETRDAAGNVRPMNDVLMDLANVFAANADGPEKARIAIELFGRSGLNLIPFLDKGKEGVRELLTAMGEPVRIDEMAKAYEKWEIATAKLDQSMLHLKVSLVPVLDLLTQIVEKGLSIPIDFWTGRAGSDRVSELAKRAGFEISSAGEAMFKELTTSQMGHGGKYGEVAITTPQEENRLTALGMGQIPGPLRLTEEQAALEFIFQQIKKGNVELGKKLELAQGITAEFHKAGAIGAGEAAGKSMDAWAKRQVTLKDELSKYSPTALEKQVKDILDLMNMPGEIEQKMTQALFAGKVAGPPTLPDYREVDRLRDSLAKVEAVQAQTQPGKQVEISLLQQELAERQSITAELQAEIRGRLENASVIGSDSEELGKLTTKLNENNDAIVKLQGTLLDRTPMGQFISGFQELAATVSHFSGGLSTTLNQIAALGEVAFNAFTKLSKLGGGDASKGFKQLIGNLGENIATAEVMVGTFMANIGAMVQGGSLNRVMGGASMGALIGSIVPGIGTAIGAAIGSAVGAISDVAAGGKIGFSWKGALSPLGPLGGFIVGSIQKKHTRELATQIRKEINDTVASLKAGTETLGAAITDLEAQRAAAVAKLSGKKGGKKELDAITTDLDAQLAQLKAQQKQILDGFASSIALLKVPEGAQAAASSIQAIAKTLKDAGDAGATAAQQLEYFNLSIAALKTSMGQELRTDEQQTIDLLLQEIDVRQQRDDIIKQAAADELAVRQRLGLARALTPGQQAAVEIKAIHDKEAADLKANDAAQAQLEAQLAGRAELFGLNVQNLSIDDARTKLVSTQLDLERQVTAEIVARIQAQQAFYGTLTAGKIPQLPAGLLPTGQTLPGQVTVQHQTLEFHFPDMPDNPHEFARRVAAAWPEAVRNMNRGTV